MITAAARRIPAGKTLHSRVVGCFTKVQAASNVSKTSFYSTATGGHLTSSASRNYRFFPETLHSSPSLVNFNQERGFASRSRRPRNDKKDVLINEKLVKFIMRRHPNTPPHEVMIRLVIDEGRETPAAVSVVSLSDAIKCSVDRETDLIGTSLETDPPVIRASSFSKLEYKQQQSQQKGNTKNKQQKKTFRFRAGISDHDLNRKLKDIIKFLQQGAECEYSVFSKARLLRENANAGMELVDRIQAMLGETGQLKRAPQRNELGTYVKCQLIPKAKKSVNR